MLHVRTLGISEIVIGDRRIAAEATTGFTLLLLAALRAPRRLPRQELSMLLWAQAPAAVRNHRMRSLLHRTRLLGAKLESSETVVWLDDTPSIDFREFVTPPRSLDEVRRRVQEIGPALAGVDQAAGASLTARLDDERDVIRATVMRWVSGALAMAKAAGEWPLVEQLARAGRELDPFNEEAWKSLAEAQRLTAGRARARRTLDEYITTVADDEEGEVGGSGITIPPAPLRPRVAEQGACSELFDDAPPECNHAVGARVGSSIARAMRGEGGSALLVWGAARSGKTALLHGTVRGRGFPSIRALSCDARASHARGSMSFAIHLIGQLLDVPGAAGCDPRCYRALCRLRSSGPNDALTDRATSSVSIDGALVELCAAIGDEGPLVILVDDAQLLRVADWRLLGAALERRRELRLVWIFAYSATTEDDVVGVPEPDLLPRAPLASPVSRRTRRPSALP
jgi:DNA-binding SARP family transcriptional activator